MSSGSIEDRLMQLEQKVRRLEGEPQPLNETIPWWERIAGAFENDAVYAEVMKLARNERTKDCPKECSE